MRAIARGLLLLLALPLAGQTKVDVLTQHNDFDRTGHNPREAVLTPDAVKKSFGKLFDVEVDSARTTPTICRTSCGTVTSWPSGTPSATSRSSRR